MNHLSNYSTKMKREGKKRGSPSGDRVIQGYSNGWSKIKMRGLPNNVLATELWSSDGLSKVSLRRSNS